MEESKNLWAPWRIEYILSAKDQDCFLCDRRESRDNKEDNDYVLFRGINAFVMLNAYPYNSGHLLISPYEHVGDIAQLSKETLYEISDIMVLAKNVLTKIMKPAGFNVGYNLDDTTIERKQNMKQIIFYFALTIFTLTSCNN